MTCPISLCRYTVVQMQRMHWDDERTANFAELGGYSY